MQNLCMKNNYNHKTALLLNLKLDAAKNMNEFTFKEETRIVWKVFTLFVYISVVTNQFIRRLKASD